MKCEILDNLNDEQRIPATETYGGVLVTAGAGSGKTRMLTHRIAYLVKELSISPFNILAITFTNKAANEMKQRISTMIDGAENMWICTFHAMCSKILRMHADRIGYTNTFTIYGDVEKNRAIKKLIENIDTKINTETFAWHISNAKNNILSPDEYARYIFDKEKCATITKVYKEYEQSLKKSNALDFDDLLTKCYDLFVSCPDVLEKYQEKFKFIHVDEFQDTNKAQYILIKLLAGQNKNVFVVGDEDQCIYSWRGANIDNIKSFIVDFNAKVFKLEQNYRSTKNIVKLANKLIKRNNNRIDKNLWTNNDIGSSISQKELYSDLDEGEYVAEKIEQLHTIQGYKYSEIAVLMRINSMSRILEEKLLTYNIPYKVYGGFKFFERKEIKDTLAYLHLISNPRDTDAMMRALSFPKKGIGDTSITKLIEIATLYNVSIMQIIEEPEKFEIQGALQSKLVPVKMLFDDLNDKAKTMNLVDFVTYVVNRVGIKEAIGTKTEEDENKCLNIDDFVVSVQEYCTANEDATLEDYLQSITLLRDIDSLNDEDDFVSLITVHSAKGLEFKNVLIVGLNDGIFPLSRAINSTDPNELEEERRLMYVAMTRAKENLFLSRAKMKFNFETRSYEYTAKSRFLDEIFDEPNKNQINSFSSVSKYKISNYNNENKPRKESLDEKMSSHINVVNVSGQNDKTNYAEMKTNKIDYAKFKKGTKVKHAHFGEGVITLGVTDFASAFVTIKFDTVGIKTLSLKYANLEIID